MTNPKSALADAINSLILDEPGAQRRLTSLLAVANSARVAGVSVLMADDTVLNPLLQRVPVPHQTQEGEVMKGENSGGSVDYYQVHIEAPTTEGRQPYTAECNDVIEALGMTFAEANVFKALWRSAAARTLCKLKANNDAVRDAEKCVFFSQRVLVQATRAAALASRVEAGKLVSTPDHSGLMVPIGVVPRATWPQTASNPIGVTKTE